MGDPARLPPVVQQPGQPGGSLPVVWDLGQDPDLEQLGRPDLLEEYLPKVGEEDHRRREKGEGLGGFGLAEREAREAKSPRAEWRYGASTPVYKSFCGHG